MKNSLAALSCLVAWTAVAAPADVSGAPLRLAAGGRTPYAIVTDGGASANVRFAAWDLARILGQVTGAEFPQIETGSAALDGKRRIEVGTAAGLKRAGAARVAKIGPEGSLALSLENGDILLVGRDDYGVTGAVYDFLEKQLGCRWYTAYRDSHIPKIASPVLKPFETLVNPPFESRWLMTIGNLTCATRDGDLALFRNGQNMTGFPAFKNVTLPKDCPALTCSQYISSGYCHTLFNVIPPHGKEDYFGRHPDWFSLSRGKKGDPGRRVDSRHLCFSNPGLRAEYKRKFLAQVDRSRTHAGVFGISAMDFPGPLCDCDDCQAFAEKYGTPGAAFFDFLGEVARELAVRHPKALLSTLAYRREQTQRPPNASFPKFPSNVLIVFAPIGDDFSKDFSHPHNADTLRDIANWRKFADHVWAWYYPIPFDGIKPNACIRRSARDIRLMRDAGVTGTGFEHRVGRDRGSNFFDMHLWVMMKLFREPDLDVEKLVRTFCNDYYGAAADDVWRYWDSLERARENHPVRVQWDGSLPAAYTPANIADWMRTMDAAEAKVANDAAALQRVREARLGLDNLVLKRYSNLRSAKPPLTVSPETLCDRLTNTFVRAAFRRGLGSRPGELPGVRTLYMLAGAGDLKPAEFKDVPDADFMQSFAIKGGTGCKRRPDADSVIGEALWDDKEGVSGRKDLALWVFDGVADREILKTHIRQKDMVEGRYAFYKLGTVKLTPSTYIVVGDCWIVLNALDDLYTPGTDERWDVYVSMKFEGPQYFPSSKLNYSRASFDRSVLIRRPRPAVARGPTLFFAGDSTLDDHGYSLGGKIRAPYSSWGTELQKSMKAGCRVANYARSGASTKSFAASGRWAELIAAVREGDFVVIQFGHNDQKRSTEFYRRERWADPRGLFREIVRGWVGEVRAKGATPILASPICRATFDASGRRLVDTEHASVGVCLGSYREAMRELSAELNCEFVDMNALTRGLMERLGRAKAERFFVISTGLVRGKDGEPAKDTTHPIQTGAAAFAKLFRDDVRARGLSVARLFRNRDFPITAFGAAEGKEKCTEAFAAAMAACEKAGGGRVVVPRGKWRSGAIRFRSNCELHLAEGSEIVFSQDPADYLPAVHTSWEGMECWNYCPLVYAYCCTNVALTGTGTLRGYEGAWEDTSWYPWVWQENGIKAARLQLYTWGATDHPVEKREIYRMKNANTRPHLLQFNRCRGVTWRDFKVRNSPFWTLHLYLCEDASVRNLDVRAHGNNNDGIDIEMSRNVIVEDCRFDQGDDGIVIKSGRNRDAWRLATPTSDVFIRDCEIVNGHTLLGIGSEISGGVRNVRLVGCTGHDVHRAVFIKTNRRRGGVLENISVADVTVGNVAEELVGLSVDTLYEWADFPDYENRTTRISDIDIRRVRAKTAMRRLKLVGDAKLPVRNFSVRDVRVDRAARPDTVKNVALADADVPPRTD